MVKNPSLELVLGRLSLSLKPEYMYILDYQLNALCKRALINMALVSEAELKPGTTFKRIVWRNTGEILMDCRGKGEEGFGQVRGGGIQSSSTSGDKLLPVVPAKNRHAV